MQKMSKNGQVVQEISQFEKSSNLIGRELSGLNLENKNFPAYAGWPHYLEMEKIKYFPVYFSSILNNFPV